jgi:HK97 family phage major capsid protein
MKNSKSYLESRSEVVESMENLVNLAKSEERDLTSDEQTKFDDLNLKADGYSADAKRAAKYEALQQEKVKSTPLSAEETDAKRSWSLFKAVNEIRNGGSLTGLEAELHQEAEKEARKGMQGIGMPSWMTEKRAIDQANSAIQPTSVGAYIDSLQQAGLWNRVGVQNLGTVAADTVLPIAGGSTVAWQTEVGAAADGGADFGKVTLSPKRLTGYANLSNVILAQNGPAAEASVMNDLGRNMSTQIDAAMFASANVANAPGCIVGTAGTLTFTESAAGGAAGAASDMLEAIQTIANNHGLDGNLAFVNNWALYSNIKAASEVANVSPLYMDDKLAGYPGYFTNATATAGGPPITSADGLFGDFSRVFFATFGPSNIMVDPYSRATNNEVRLVMNNHFDFGVASGASFVKYTTVL